MALGSAGEEGAIIVGPRQAKNASLLHFERALVRQATISNIENTNRTVLATDGQQRAVVAHAERPHCTAVRVHDHAGREGGEVPLYNRGMVACAEEATVRGKGESLNRKVAAANNALQQMR